MDRSTFLPLQHTATLISSVDWGLVDVEQIHSVNEQLYALVVACILADCGVSKELREEVVNRARSKYVIRL